MFSTETLHGNKGRKNVLGSTAQRPKYGWILTFLYTMGRTRKTLTRWCYVLFLPFRDGSCMALTVHMSYKTRSYKTRTPGLLRPGLSICDSIHFK